MSPFTNTVHRLGDVHDSLELLDSQTLRVTHSGQDSQEAGASPASLARGTWVLDQLYT